MSKQAVLGALKHGAAVAAHIAAAIILAVVGYYLFTGQDELVSILKHYGLSVGLINVLIATVQQLYKNQSQAPATPSAPQQ